MLRGNASTVKQTWSLIKLGSANDLLYPNTNFGWMKYSIALPNQQQANSQDGFSFNWNGKVAQVSEKTFFPKKVVSTSVMIQRIKNMIRAPQKVLVQKDIMEETIGNNQWFRGNDNPVFREDELVDFFQQRGFSRSDTEKYIANQLKSGSIIWIDRCRVYHVSPKDVSAKLLQEVPGAQELVNERLREISAQVHDMQISQSLEESEQSCEQIGYKRMKMFLHFFIMEHILQICLWTFMGVEWELLDKFTTFSNQLQWVFPAYFYAIYGENFTFGKFKERLQKSAQAQYVGSKIDIEKSSHRLKQNISELKLLQKILRTGHP